MKTTRSATLEDIAKRLGVHRSTVSLAMRDSPRISPEMRRKVKAIADEFGYRMNPLVAALMKSRRTGYEPQQATLAFVTNHSTRFGWRSSHSAHPDCFSGAAERARKLGYKLEHFWLTEPGMTSERFAQILLTRDIHGLVLGGICPNQPMPDIPWSHFSSVALGMALDSPRLHCVTRNHFDTAWRAVRECCERGYERVGFVFSGTGNSPCAGDRWLGAYFQQQAKFPVVDQMPVCPGLPTDEASFLEWFCREKPDALIVTHAAPVLRWLKVIAHVVPSDVGLVELQDNPAMDSSGIYYDPARMGALAVELLVGLLQRNERGVQDDQYEVMLTGEWREGKTLPWRVRESTDRRFSSTAGFSMHAAHLG